MDMTNPVARLRDDFITYAGWADNDLARAAEAVGEIRKLAATGTAGQIAVMLKRRDDAHKRLTNSQKLLDEVTAALEAHGIDTATLPRTRPLPRLWEDEHIHGKSR